MAKQIYISIYLDTRRTKANGKYPVKLRVFNQEPRKQMLYPTIFDFTKKEFQNIWITTKPSRENITIREELQSLVTMAYEKSSKITPFSFEEYDKSLITIKSDQQNLILKYKEQIDRLKALDQIGTAQNYASSLKSLLAFNNSSLGKEAEILHFREITPLWLEKYQKHMVDLNNRSLTTVSMYLRSLRAIFNNAIADKDIEPELYPFGKRLYTIPRSNGVKKYLDKSKLKLLLQAVPKTSEQEKARDFWFFSYFCNGINIKDLALLKFKDWKNESISFIRSKTKNTSKSNIKIIKVPVNKMAENIILKYAKISEDPNDYIFSIVDYTDSELTKFRKIKNFTKFINQNLKKLAIDNGLTNEISTYWARHSFADIAIKSGKHFEFVGDAFGHSNIKTTQAYFAGFDDKTKKEFSDQLMDFD
ncbi:MAG: site-specific integrase [Saprospiraceae bacterium]|nr:site-specific integrase [Candidatus Defluviibacterium haderslevense]